MEPTEAEPKKPRTLPPDERREQLMVAACAVFAERGYHEAKISDITERAGAGKGTFYLYFKSKEDMYGALLDDFTRNIFLAFFIPGVEEVKTSRDIHARFLRVTNNALNLLSRNGNLSRLFLQEGLKWEPEFQGRLRKAHHDIAANAAVNLAAWMDQGLLREGNALVIANCVMGMIERIAVQLLAGRLSGEIDEIVKDVVKFELYGILQHPEEVFG